MALALSYVACSAHAGVSKPEPIVAKEFSFSDELNDAFVVALGSNVAAVPLSAGEHAALAGDDPSAVMMTAHDGQRYFCALPRQSRDADGGDASGGAGDGTGEGSDDGAAETDGIEVGAYGAWHKLSSGKSKWRLQAFS